MKRGKIFTDASLLALIAVNIYSVYYYFMHPEIFTTLIWLYWSQSVMIGFFNFLDLLTLGKVDADFTNTSGNPIKPENLKYFAAFFFLFHYGFFHLVYALFIMTFKITGPFDWEFFKIFLMLFLGSQIINFVQRKMQYRKEMPNIGKMFFLPYLRIIPMHLCILLPAFLGWGNMQVFVVLKVVADILTYIFTSPRYKPEKPSMKPIE